MKSKTDSESLTRLAAYGLVISAFLWIALFSLRPIANYDLWWHAATGRYIWSHGHIPKFDLFSYTSPGSRWVNNYWIYEVLLYGLYRFFGWNGFLVLKIGLLLSIFSVLYARLRIRRIGPVLSIAAVAATFWLSRPAPYGWDVEANLVSLLGVSLLLLHLESAALMRKQLGSLWVWPAAFAVWSNTHPVFVIGLAIAGIFAVANSCEDPRLFGKMTAWLAMCVLATLFNVNGFAIYKTVWMGLRTGGIIQHMEWTSFLPFEWGFWSVALLLWVGLFYRFRRGEHLPYWVYGAAFALTGLAIRHNVCVPYFMIFAVPLILAWLPPSRLYAKSMHLIRPWAASLCFIGALSIIILSMKSVIGRPLGVDRYMAPVDACDFIDREKLTRQRFFNDYRFGGYWIWRFADSSPVFFDSRFPTVQGYIPLVREFITSWQDSPLRFQKMLEAYGVTAALVGYQDVAPTVQDLRFPRRQWALVYWDDTSLIYLKRIPSNSRWIRRLGVSDIYPDIDPDQFVADVQRLGRQERENTRKSLLRNLQMHPDSFRTKLLLSAISGLS